MVIFFIQWLMNVSTNKDQLHRNCDNKRLMKTDLIFSYNYISSNKIICNSILLYNWSMFNPAFNILNMGCVLKCQMQFSVGHENID